MNDFYERMDQHPQNPNNNYQEIIASVTPDGLISYVAIDINGHLVTFYDVNNFYNRLTNDIRSRVHGSASLFIRYILQNGSLMRIEVSESQLDPASRGQQRIDMNTDYPVLSQYAIENQNHTFCSQNFENAGFFESDVSPIQNLSFEAAKFILRRFNIDFSPDLYPTWGLKQNNAYTNLALLLSDQCRHSIKAAVYDDETCTVFRDRKEFTGSILQQFEEVCHYLDLSNRTASTINGMNRTDYRDYPEEAIREALLNAIIHRDYHYSGSIMISITDRQMSFTSLGGLMPGLSKDDLRLNISQTRNKKLADLFHQLHLSESYGTGIRRIFKCYENFPSQPDLEITANAFKITLPNMNAATTPAPIKAETPIQISTETPVQIKAETPVKTKMETPVQVKPEKKVQIKTEKSAPIKSTDSAEHPVIKSSASSLSVTPQIKVVLDYLTVNGEMSEAELQSLLGVKRTRAYLVAKQMCDDGLIQIKGRGSGKKYTLL